MTHASVTRAALFLAATLLAGLAALLLDALGIPSPWIFAFLCVFGLLAILGDRRVVPPARVMNLAQVIIALLCVAPLSTVGAAGIAGYLLPGVVSVFITLLMCAAAAWVLIRGRGIPMTTAGLSTLAGGASAMVLLAREIKADVGFVTLTQYLRVAIVVLSLPPLILGLDALSSANPTAAHPASSPGADPAPLADAALASTAPGVAMPASAPWWALELRGLLGAAIVWALVWLLVAALRRWVSLPSPYLLVTMAIGYLGLSLGVPAEWLTPQGLAVTATFAIIGVQAGGALTTSALRSFADAVPVIVAAVGVMIGASLLTAWGIHAVWGYTLVDSYLATVPGGIYAALAFAHDAGSDPVVTVIQVLRVIAMLIVGAALPRVLPRWAARQQR